MRVLLRNAKIGLYHAGRKHRVGSPDAAADPRTIECAAELSGDENFEEMEVVVGYEDPAWELVLPLHARKPPAANPALSRG
jgi:hypothetical protein